MRRPGFLEGALVAVVGSAGAGVTFAALAGVVPLGLALSGVVTAVALGYLLYLLSRTPRRVGRVTALAGWLVLTGAMVVLDPPLVIHVLVQAGALWLVRALHYHRSVLGALADLGLGALSLAAAAWALERSGSVALAVWCLLLVQALFVAIPAEGPRASRAAPEPDDDSFERAHRSAEQALRRMSAAH